MNRLEKLFKKLSQKDGQLLREIVEQLQKGDTHGLNIQKISGSDFYRLKKRNFRLIFHWESGAPVIDSIRLRNERTYKNL